MFWTKRVVIGDGERGLVYRNRRFERVLAPGVYRWFDPMTLMRLGFDTREFSGETFNFMYQDTTATLGVAKFWFWLVVPLVAVTISVHALSNLLRTVATPVTARIPSGLPVTPTGDGGAKP